MNSDSAFYIGSTHDVCQDFSLSGKISKDNILYSIVADGCSSSLYSSIGARILSFSAQKELNKIYRNNAGFFDFQDDICIERSRSSISSLNIPVECLDSTLITACSEEYETNIDMKGDGVVAIGLLNGDILIISVEFPSGYPYYMNYLPSYSKRYNIWAEANNECLVKMSIILSNGEYKILEKECGDHYAYATWDHPHRYIFASPTEYGVEIEIEGQRKNIGKYIVIMSDGIKSFYEPTDNGTSRVNKPIDYHDVIYKILDFKNFNGQFMQRRLNKFLKQCTKFGWYHYDDISFGAIYLE